MLSSLDKVGNKKSKGKIPSKMNKKKKLNAENKQTTIYTELSYFIPLFELLQNIICN